MEKTLAELLKEDIDIIKRNIDFDYTIVNDKDCFLNMGIDVKDKTTVSIWDVTNEKELNKYDSDYLNILEQIVSAQTLKGAYNWVIDHAEKENKTPMEFYTEQKKYVGFYIEHKYKDDMFEMMFNESEIRWMEENYNTKLYVKDNDTTEIVAICNKKSNALSTPTIWDKDDGENLVKKKIKEQEVERE